MTPFTLTQQRQSLERAYTKSHVLYHLGTGLRSIGRSILHFLSENTQPRISAIKSSRGDCQYRVYDPVDGQTAYLGSEAALRAWLEQRYYR